MKTAHSNPTTLIPAILRSHVWVYRIRSRLTQQQLADRVGVSRNTLHAIETNKRNPSVLLALCLARELGAKVEDIFRVA